MRLYEAASLAFESQTSNRAVLSRVDTGQQRTLEGLGQLDKPLAEGQVRWRWRGHRWRKCCGLKLEVTERDKTKEYL